MKRFKKLLIALTSLFSVVALFPLSACSGGAMHTLTLVNENEDGGTLSGAGEYKTGSQVVLSYNANKGYKFDKWDVDGQIIKLSNKTYTFKMPDKDITVKGSFIPKKYEVRVHQAYNAKVTGTGTYDYNSEVTLTCIPDTGYRLVGWYEEDKDTILSSEEVYTFKMPARDLVINADTEMAPYKVTLVCSDPYHADVYIRYDSFYYENSYTVLASYKNLIDNEHYGIKALYRYDNGVKGDLIANGNTFTMPACDCTIYVEIERMYEVSFNGMSSMSYNPFNFVGTKYVLNCYESDIAPFIGWYEEDGSLLSTDHSYTYITKDYDTAVQGKYNYDKGVYFGEYPQDLVIDNDLMDELDKLEPYITQGYLEYEGEKYYRNGESKISMVCLNSTQEVYQDFTYRTRYYKVQPILWQVMHKVPNTDLTLLMSKYILDYKSSPTEANADSYSYRTSEARKFLNGGFYTNCFSEEEKSMIQEVAVDAYDTTKLVDKFTYDGDFYTDKVLVPGTLDSLYYANNGFNQLNNEMYFGSFLTDGFCTDLATGSSNNYNTIYEHSWTKNFSLGSSLCRDGYGSTYWFSIYGQVTKGTSKRVTTSFRPMIFVKGL